MPILTSLRSGAGAGFALFKGMFRPAPDATPERVDRFHAPGVVDFTDFRQRLIDAMQFRQAATAVLQNPFVSPPPHATIIDKTGILTMPANNEINSFDDYAGTELKYTCPDDHLAVIRFWGFTGIYSADELIVNEAYKRVVFSLLGDDACLLDGSVDVANMTGQIQPYVNQYRPGPAEAICLNAMIPVKPGHQIVPVMVADGAAVPTSGLIVLCRLWGWHWPHGEPGAL